MKRLVKLEADIRKYKQSLKSGELTGMYAGMRQHELLEEQREVTDLIKRVRPISIAEIDAQAEALERCKVLFGLLHSSVNDEAPSQWTEKQEKRWKQYERLAEGNFNLGGIANEMGISDRTLFNLRKAAKNYGKIDPRSK